MKLVYERNGALVQAGDRAVLRNGSEVEVLAFRQPHKPASSGKVTVRDVDSKIDAEYYVSVIGAEWVEREDRGEGA